MFTSNYYLIKKAKRKNYCVCYMFEFYYLLILINLFYKKKFKKFKTILKKILYNGFFNFIPSINNWNTTFFFPTTDLNVITRLKKRYGFRRWLKKKWGDKKHYYNQRRIVRVYKLKKRRKYYWMRLKFKRKKFFLNKFRHKKFYKFRKLYQYKWSRYFNWDFWKGSRKELRKTLKTTKGFFTHRTLLKYQENIYFKTTTNPLLSLVLDNSSNLTNTYFLFFLSLASPLVTNTKHSISSFAAFNQLAFERYLKGFFNTPIKLKTYNLGYLNSDEFVHKLTLMYRRKIPRSLNFIYLQDILDFFFTSFLLKDLTMIKKWLKIQFESKPFKVLGRMYYFCYLTLFKLTILFKKEFGLLGFFLQFSGKITKGGSRKKKRKYFWGSKSFTTKTLRINYFTISLRTLPGVVSCKMRIFY